MSRELTSSEIADRANRGRISATQMPYFPSFSGRETRLPPTPSLARPIWPELTDKETIAKALANKLKECDTMHKELERLRNIERLVINTRNDQQAGKIPNDAPLPSAITSLLPHIDTSTSTSIPTPPPILSDTTTKRANVRFGGRRRKTTRRRRKTKRIKKRN
jgi:hypothetical protein